MSSTPVAYGDTRRIRILRGALFILDEEVYLFEITNHNNCVRSDGGFESGHSYNGIMTRLHREMLDGEVRRYWKTAGSTPMHYIPHAELTAIDAEILNYPQGLGLDGLAGVILEPKTERCSAVRVYRPARS